jgi:ParB-like chromosome segregation protein Spo0J
MDKLLVPIETIKLWENNPREISDKDFQSLKGKIERWGIWKPFLVWESKKQILGGNQRYKACKELGHKEIWVEYREPKDDAEALEMAIADNESSGEWIKPLLIEQLKLSEDKIDLKNYRIVIDNIDLVDLKLEEDHQEKDKDFEFRSVIRVFVDCTDEDMQEKVFNDLQSLGYEPKVINV